MCLRALSLPHFLCLKTVLPSSKGYREAKTDTRIRNKSKGNSIKLTCILCLSTSQGTYTMEPSVSPEKRKKLWVMMSPSAFLVTQSFKTRTYDSNCVLPSFHKTFYLKAGFNQDGLYCFKDGSWASSMLNTQLVWHIGLLHCWRERRHQPESKREKVTCCTSQEMGPRACQIRVLALQPIFTRFNKPKICGSCNHWPCQSRYNSAI